MIKNNKRKFAEIGEIININSNNKEKSRKIDHDELADEFISACEKNNLPDAKRLYKLMKTFVDIVDILWESFINLCKFTISAEMMNWFKSVIDFRHSLGISSNYANCALNAAKYNQLDNFMFIIDLIDEDYMFCDYYYSTIINSLILYNKNHMLKCFLGKKNTKLENGTVEVISKFVITSGNFDMFKYILSISTVTTEYYFRKIVEISLDQDKPKFADYVMSLKKDLLNGLEFYTLVRKFINNRKILTWLIDNRKRIRRSKIILICVHNSSAETFQFVYEKLKVKLKQLKDTTVLYDSIFAEKYIIAQYLLSMGHEFNDHSNSIAVEKNLAWRFRIGECYNCPIDFKSVLKVKIGEYSKKFVDELYNVFNLTEKDSYTLITQIISSGAYPEYSEFHSIMDMVYSKLSKYNALQIFLNKSIVYWAADPKLTKWVKSKRLYR